MALLLHLVFAFGSVGFTSYVFVYPSKSKLTVSYALVALTMLSGFFLVFTKPAHMVEVCTMGLLYVGFVSFGIVSARNKLAGAININKKHE